MGVSDIFFNNKTISKITLSKNLKNTLSHLKTNTLLRINRSYVINVNEIESIDNWHVKIYNIKETILSKKALGILSVNY